MYQHFQQPCHTMDDVTLEVLGRLEVNDKVLLRQNENSWIRVLMTAWPYGFNDKIDGFGDVSSGQSPMFKPKQPYFSMKIPRGRPKRKTNVHKRCKKWTEIEIDNQIQDLYANTTNLGGIYRFMRSLSKRYVRKVLLWALNKNFGTIQADNTLMAALIGYCAGYFKKEDDNFRKEKAIFITADFHNKGMDIINFKKLLRRQQLAVHLPRGIHLPNFSIAYKFLEPISLQLTNYSKELAKYKTSKLDTESFRCKCAGSPYVYDPVGHIITGDLTIIDNAQLEAIFRKGTKFREDTGISWDVIAYEGEQILKKLVTKVSLKLKINQDLFKNFCIQAKCLINDTVDRLSKKFPPYFKPSALKIQKNSHRLRELHNQFIICCADKTPNNYVFICKHYYMDRINQELGISFNNSSKKWDAVGNMTYSLTQLTKTEIIKRHKGYTTLQPFNLDFASELERIPRIYGLPKLHKNPYGTRFICGAGNTCIMPLSTMLHHVLSHLREHFGNYCRVIESRTGTRCYWSINNNELVIKNLVSHTNGRKTSHANSYDFSTLFTMLPHNVIKKELYFVADMLFSKNGSKQFLAVNKKACTEKVFAGGKTTFYTTRDDNTSKFAYLTKEDVKLLIKINLEEAYVSFAEHIFKQDYGISMGGSASPVTCDLTLSVLEYKYLTKRENLHIARRLASVYRYIDDILCTSISGTEFEAIVKEIYPSSLPLGHASGNQDGCNFLDLQIHIRPNLRISVYDKTDSFNFQVVKFIFSDSNVSINTGRNVFLSQLVRYARICTHFCDFKNKSKELCRCMLSHGFEKPNLIAYFFKFANKNKLLLYKYGIIDKLDLCRLAHFIF
ncbi:MAG: hypothetical protein GY738_14315 [Pseudoalteromonas sp.]|nr:hypothetical protein [Pseudoalteromonas sp.]